MSFKVTVLGSSGMFATTDRAASGYLLALNGTFVWLDAGAGTWRNLLSHIAYQDLDGVILSHRHPDHTTDIFQAQHARLFGQAEPLEKLPLWAPSETLSRLEGFSDGISDAFDLRPVAPGDHIVFAGAAVSFHPMAHPGIETLGVRVEWQGAVFAYSADTGSGADFASLAQDADVFICESTLQDSDAEWEGHLHAGRAATIAAACGVKHLVLSHLPPGRDLGLSLAEAQRNADGMKVQLASDGLELEVVT
jgi:ribonuclease BN (tRNA processing enzyme)